MTYRVKLTREAEEDFVRLFDFIIERELTREAGERELAEEALSAIKDGLGLLERFPFTCRKVGARPFVRELIVPFGHAGYVALFEIVDDETVVVGAVRHQRDDDFTSCRSCVVARCCRGVKFCLATDGAACRAAQSEQSSGAFDPEPTFNRRGLNERRAQVRHWLVAPPAHTSSLTSLAFHRPAAAPARRSPLGGYSEESDSRLRS